MQALEIEGQTEQGPFASSLVQAAQRELAEAQDLLDDANHGFHRGLAHRIDALADFGPQLVGHVDSQGCGWAGWVRQGLQQALPRDVMRLAPGGNVGVDLARQQPCDR
jgi:hypothetical protein